MTSIERRNMGIDDLEKFKTVSPFSGKVAPCRSAKWLEKKMKDLKFDLIKARQAGTQRLLGNEYWQEYRDKKTGNHYRVRKSKQSLFIEC